MKRNVKATKLLVLAALCALAVTGCKKKEPVDLSSLHSTAAVEKETMADTTAEETTAPAIESESKPAQSGYTLTTEIKSETVGESTIEYPVISSMKDTELQEKANALLKANAVSIAQMYPKEALNITAEVESINLKRITAVYTGEDSDGNRIFFSNTVDLESIQNLGLSDFADPYTMAGYIVSEDCIITKASDKSEAKEYLASLDVKTLYATLKNSDFTSGSNGFPEAFSYVNQGIIYISVPVPHALGDYVIVEFHPEGK